MNTQDLAPTSAATPAAPAGLPANAQTWAPFEEALRQHFPSREALLAEARAQTRRRSPKRAAVGTVLLAAWLAGVWWLDPLWSSEVVRTAVGEQGRWTQSDGSTIALNTNSELRVERRLRTRHFVLERGEAAFDVAHGWRTFSVQAGDTTVVDIGTAFTERRMAGGAEVTVQQGAVEVHESSGDMRVLRAGQSLQAVESGSVQAPREVDAAAVNAWQQGRIVFDGTPLRLAVAELQRHRNAPIVLADERAGELRLSGAYDLRSLESLLDTLPQALPVQVTRTDDGSVHIGSRELGSRDQIREKISKK